MTSNPPRRSRAPTGFRLGCSTANPPGGLLSGRRADVPDDLSCAGRRSGNADDVATADIGADGDEQCIGGAADDATLVVPPMPMIDCGRPLANVVISPVLGFDEV